MTIAALVVSIVGVVVALAATLVATQVSRTIAGSGFQAEEQLKRDLVEVLAAIRSVIVSGILAGQDHGYRPLEIELEVVRRFQTCTSGFALWAWAAEQGQTGGPDSTAAGHWRALGLRLALLAGAGSETTWQQNVRNAELAADIELTLEQLSRQDVESISDKIGDLADGIAAIKTTRDRDLLLRAFFEHHAGLSTAS